MQLGFGDAPGGNEGFAERQFLVAARCEKRDEIFLRNAGALGEEVGEVAVLTRAPRRITSSPLSAVASAARAAPMINRRCRVGASLWPTWVGHISIG